MNINEFNKKLGSTSPTPGGGAAAGISLSMGAACVEKAARFSLGEKELHDLVDKFVNIREEGLKLSDKDQKAFQAWQESRKLSKGTEEEKRIRKEKIDQYAAECAMIPYQICKHSHKLIGLIQDFIQYCNKWLISDAAIGALLSKAAYDSSIFNITINLPYIKDKKIKNEITFFLKNNSEHINKMTEEIIMSCNNILNE